MIAAAALAILAIGFAGAAAVFWSAVGVCRAEGWTAAAGRCRLLAVGFAALAVAAGGALALDW